jgi:hypothetical protein
MVSVVELTRVVPEVTLRVVPAVTMFSALTFSGNRKITEKHKRIDT